MDVLDYRSSFVINTSAIDGTDINTCRTQILARCVVSNESTGEAGDFFLGKECISEAMYKDTHVAHTPTSEASIIFSDVTNALNKKFADHSNDISQVGGCKTRRLLHDGRYAYWPDVNFHLSKVAKYPFKSRKEIIKATLGCKPMTGRTTIVSENGVWTAIVEYPIMYMNVHPPDHGFQVDAGPVLVPDFFSNKTELVSRLDYAYVMYNQMDNAEFAIRKPTQVGGSETMHYSEVLRVKATNELYSLIDSAEGLTT